MHAPASLLTAVTGLITGYAYRSDLMQLKSWRVPHRYASCNTSRITVNHDQTRRAVTFSRRWIGPILDSGTQSRRSNRVFPESPIHSLLATLGQDEVVTTARTPASQRNTSTRRSTASASSQSPSSDGPTPSNANTVGVVQQWVSEIERAARPNGSGDLRVPSEPDIQILTSVFPDVGRDVIIGVLQRRSAHCPSNK